MNWNLKMLKKYAMFGGIAIALSFVGSAIAYPVTVKLLANAEWLPEGSGVLLSTDKGYVHIYNDNMYELGNSKKGECYILEADTEDYVTLHKNKFPDLKALDSQREVSSWKKTTNLRRIQLLRCCSWGGSGACCAHLWSPSCRNQGFS